MQSEGKQVPLDDKATCALGVRPDIVTTYTDRLNHEWTLMAELKSINGRPEIATLVVHSAHTDGAVNRRLLRELPLGLLFDKAIAAEARHLNQSRNDDRNTHTTKHQGRRHTDDELRTVAQLYMDAQGGRRPVQTTVAKALGISIAATNRRIIAARRRGLLLEISENNSNQKKEKEFPNDKDV